MKYLQFFEDFSDTSFEEGPCFIYYKFNENKTSSPNLPERVTLDGLVELRENMRNWGIPTLFYSKFSPSSCGNYIMLHKGNNGELLQVYIDSLSLTIDLSFIIWSSNYEIIHDLKCIFDPKSGLFPSDKNEQNFFKFINHIERNFPDFWNVLKKDKRIEKISILGDIGF